MPDLHQARPGFPTDEEIEKAKVLWRRDKQRLMEYFWSRKRRDYRPHVPTAAIHFVESERRDYEPSRIDFVLFKLQNDENFIVESSSGSDRGYILTEEGKIHLVKKHPTPIQYWEKALQLTPPTISLLVALIGFVASVFGIVEFAYWYQSLKH